MSGFRVKHEQPYNRKADGRTSKYETNNGSQILLITTDKFSQLKLNPLQQKEYEGIGKEKYLILFPRIKKNNFRRVVQISLHFE